MNKKQILFLSLFIAAFTFTALLLKPSNGPRIHYNLGINNVEIMPIVGDDPYAHLAKGGVPIEQRNEEYRKWLSVSLKIAVSGGSGSGTIVYFDDKSGYAYVQSCGHLWSGNMTSEEGQQKKITAKVITWYHNGKKLDNPLEYSAEVLYFSNTRGYDISLLRFKPDWVPLYVPIAPPDFAFKKDMRLNSCGADGGREVAHYDVRYLGEFDQDIVTTENSPRPGRSGGGLMSEDLYVGICWGTTDRMGTGNGLFTPLKIVRMMNEKEGFGWLNDVGVRWARQIPIIDRNNPQSKYPPDYIPLPRP